MVKACRRCGCGGFSPPSKKTGQRRSTNAAATPRPGELEVRRSWHRVPRPNVQQTSPTPVKGPIVARPLSRARCHRSLQLHAEPGLSVLVDPSEHHVKSLSFEAASLLPPPVVTVVCHGHSTKPFRMATVEGLSPHRRNNGGQAQRMARNVAGPVARGSGRRLLSPSMLGPDLCPQPPRSQEVVMALDAATGSCLGENVRRGVQENQYANAMAKGPNVRRSVSEGKFLRSVSRYRPVPGTPRPP